MGILRGARSWEYFASLTDNLETSPTWLEIKMFGKKKRKLWKTAWYKICQNILKICLIYGLSYFERTNTRETNETGGDWALLRFWPKSSPCGLFSNWWLGRKGASEECNLSSFHQVITTCHPPQAFIEARRTIWTAL